MQRPVWYSILSRQLAAGRCHLPGWADVSGLPHFPFESGAELIGRRAGRGKGACYLRAAVSSELVCKHRRQDEGQAERQRCQSISCAT